MPVNIGLLVPNSNFIPFFSRDILFALELGLKKEKLEDYQLIPEMCGYNAKKEVLAEKAQILLVKNRVDLVIAPLNVGMFEMVAGFFASNQVPLVVLSMGEDPIFESAQNPHIFVNSFNLWQSAWMAGYWGAETFGKRACSIAALHDGGYGMGFAFALGVEAQGGQLIQSAVTHRNSSSENPEEKIRELASNHPDFIFGLYSGKESISFLQTYQSLRLDERIPLMGLPPMAAEHLWPPGGEFPSGVKIVSSWNRRSAESRQFEQEFCEQAGHAPNPYLALAYETGQLIARAAQEIGPGAPKPNQLAEMLKDVECFGPRGLVKFDPLSQETQTCAYLQEIHLDDEGRFHYKTLDKLETPPLFFEQQALARKNLIKQGWLNPYLIA
jgi:ABC-type branched-subunit amino acid transport system substrate-binding protein